MNLIFIILLSFQSMFLSQNSTNYGLPYFESDFIKTYKTYGKQRKHRGLLHSTQRDYPRINYEVKENAPALAIESGSVEEIGTSRGRGGFITINHGNGVKARYFHLENINKKVGATVNKGDIIGISSNKGLTIVNAIGIEIRLSGERINPENILE